MIIHTELYQKYYRFTKRSFFGTLLWDFRQKKYVYINV